MKHLVIIGTVFPEPNSTAAGTRMLQLIEFFQKEEYKITFLSSASVSDFSFDLNALTIEMKNIQLNDSSFDKLISELKPDVVIFDRFITEEQFGWRVSEQCPNTIKILDTEDLHFLRKARETAFKNDRQLTENNLLSDIAKREIASILRCDLSLIISEFEMNLLVEKFRIEKDILFYLPMFGVTKPSKKTFSERKNFISIGNFLHEPNWQTVLKLKKLWPKIRKKLPDAEMHIYGAYASDKAKQLHNEKEKFLIKGRAETVEEVFSKTKVLLAPIPFGAGIKGKLLESMRYGLPNITSFIGAEGMNGNMEWNGFIADNDEDFVEKAAELYTDENLWYKVQQAGYQLLEKRFNKEKFLPDFSEKLKIISATLQEHRNKNFFGQILQHHTLQSTKYMSKWIEEKHK